MGGELLNPSASATVKKTTAKLFAKSILYSTCIIARDGRGGEEKKPNQPNKTNPKQTKKRMKSFEALRVPSRMASVV